MRRFAFYGLLFLASYGLLRIGCVKGAVSPDRLAVIYAGVLVPLSLLVSLAGIALVCGALAAARRIRWAHVRWYFFDGWLASGLVLALVLALLTVPLRNAMQLGSVGVARLLVERVIPASVPPARREVAWRTFERFWTLKFLPALASGDAPNWEQALDLLDDFKVVFGEGAPQQELERLEREVNAILPPSK